MKHLLDIKPNCGTYIYSSCEAFNEEIEIDFRRLWHWVKRFDIDSCGFSLDENGNLGVEKRCHASGHASGEDITWTIEQIDPDCIVPIHTEARDGFARSFVNVVLVEESEQYNF
jgi:ribonuclease J